MTSIHCITDSKSLKLIMCQTDLFWQSDGPFTPRTISRITDGARLKLGCVMNWWCSCCITQRENPTRICFFPKFFEDDRRKENPVISNKSWRLLINHFGWINVNHPACHYEGNIRDSSVPKIIWQHVSGAEEWCFKYTLYKSLISWMNIQDWVITVDHLKSYSERSATFKKQHYKHSCIIIPSENIP